MEAFSNSPLLYKPASPWNIGHERNALMFILRIANKLNVGFGCRAEQCLYPKWLDICFEGGGGISWRNKLAATIYSLVAYWGLYGSLSDRYEKMIKIWYKLFYDTFSVVQFFTMITFLPWIQGNFIISCVLFPYISPDTINYIIWKIQWGLWFTCTFVCGKGDTAFNIGPRRILSHSITSSISKINNSVLL